MRQVGHQLYPTDDEYREALDDYMRSMGLSGEEESHYLDFLRHTMNWQAGAAPGRGPPPRRHPHPGRAPSFRLPNETRTSPPRPTPSP